MSSKFLSASLVAMCLLVGCSSGGGSDAGGPDAGTTAEVDAGMCPGGIHFSPASCGECLELNCCAQLQTCASNESCLSYIVCTQPCTTQECGDACSAQNGQTAVNQMAQISTCGQTSCKEQCFPTEPVPDAGVPTVMHFEMGLEWQREVSPDRRNWADATTYCNQLEPGRNWVLPTRLQLVSIVDYGRPFPPAIDPHRFPLPPAINLFWTQSAYPQPDRSWIVDFETGQARGEDRINTAFVRCVRVVTPRTGMVVPNNNGTVTDSRFNLVWQQTPSASQLPAFEAQRFCDDLMLGGFPPMSWRLPTIFEHQTIVDENTNSLFSAFLNVPAFSGGWSSTDSQSQPGSNWSIDYRNSEIRGTASGLGLHVLCIKR